MGTERRKTLEERDSDHPVFRRPVDGCTPHPRPRRRGVSRRIVSGVGQVPERRKRRREKGVSECRRETTARRVMYLLRNVSAGGRKGVGDSRHRGKRGVRTRTSTWNGRYPLRKRDPGHKGERVVEVVKRGSGDNGGAGRGPQRRRQ